MGSTATAKLGRGVGAQIAVTPDRRTAYVNDFVDYRFVRGDHVSRKYEGGFGMLNLGARGQQFWGFLSTGGAFDGHHVLLVDHAQVVGNLFFGHNVERGDPDGSAGQIAMVGSTAWVADIDNSLWSITPR